MLGPVPSGRSGTAVWLDHLVEFAVAQQCARHRSRSSGALPPPRNRSRRKGPDCLEPALRDGMPEAAGGSASAPAAGGAALPLSVVSSRAARARRRQMSVAGSGSHPPPQPPGGRPQDARRRRSASVGRSEPSSPPRVRAAESRQPPFIGMEPPRALSGTAGAQAVRPARAMPRKWIRICLSCRFLFSAETYHHFAGLATNPAARSSA